MHPLALELLPALLDAPLLALPAASAKAGTGTEGGAAAAAAAGALLAPYHAYLRCLERHPLLTKALTSCAGFALGDLIAQALSGVPGAGLDAARLLRLGAFGLCVDGPLGSAWYGWLEGAVFPGVPTSAKAVVAKTVLDQVVYASAGTALFLATMAALEGHPASVASAVAEKLVPTLAANWAVWPAAHLVNFRWVPPQLRIAYNQVVAIGWLALLSAMTHSQGPSAGFGLAGLLGHGATAAP